MTFRLPAFAALSLAALLAPPVLAQVGELPPAPTVTLRRAVPAADGLSAGLTAPRSGSGPLRLTLTLRSSRAEPLPLSLVRDNDQNCAFAPTVRVLRVGTRTVVYPAPGAGVRLCTQDLLKRPLPARGRTVFTRDLSLPAGEYMIEGWFAGFADEERIKVPARPVRVTVR